MVRAELVASDSHGVETEVLFLGAPVTRSVWIAGSGWWRAWGWRERAAVWLLRVVPDNFACSGGTRGRKQKRR